MSFFDNLTKKVGDAAKTAVKKSEDLVETTKINMAIKSEEDKIKIIYGEIGKIVYSKYQAGEELEEQLAANCQHIKEIESSIEILKEKAAQIKSAPPQAGQQQAQYAPQYGVPQGQNTQQPQTQYPPQYGTTPSSVPSQYAPPYNMTPQEGPSQFTPQYGGPQYTQQSQGMPQYVPPFESGTSQAQPQSVPQYAPEPAQAQSIPQYIPVSENSEAQEQPQAVPQYVPVSEPQAIQPQEPAEAIAQPEPQAAANICPSCGTIALPQSKFCPSCGTKL